MTQNEMGRGRVYAILTGLSSTLSLPGALVRILQKREKEEARPLSEREAGDAEADGEEEGDGVRSRGEISPHANRAPTGTGCRFSDAIASRSASTSSNQVSSRRAIA